MVYTEKRKRKHDENVFDEHARSAWAMLGIGTAFVWRNVVVKPTRWTWRQCIRAGRFTLSATWGVMVWTMRAGWRATMYTVRQSWKLTRWTLLAPFRGLGWLYIRFVRGIPEPDDPFLALRWRIKRRFRRRQRFLTHLFAFISVNLLALVDFVMNNARYHSYTTRSFIGGYVVPMGLWLLLLAFHFTRMRLADAEDRTVESALEWQRDYQTPYLVEDEYTEAAHFDERYARLRDEGDRVHREHRPLHPTPTNAEVKRKRH